MYTVSGPRFSGCGIPRVGCNILSRGKALAGGMMQSKDGMVLEGAQKSGGCKNLLGSIIDKIKGLFGRKG